jgi:hypothetical protein
MKNKIIICIFIAVFSVYLAWLAYLNRDFMSYLFSSKETTTIKMGALTFLGKNEYSRINFNHYTIPIWHTTSAFDRLKNNGNWISQEKPIYYNGVRSIILTTYVDIVGIRIEKKPQLGFTIKLPNNPEYSIRPDETNSIGWDYQGNSPNIQSIHGKTCSLLAQKKIQVEYPNLITETKKKTEDYLLNILKRLQDEKLKNEDVSFLWPEQKQNKIPRNKYTVQLISILIDKDELQGDWKTQKVTSETIQVDKFVITININKSSASVYLGELPLSDLYKTPIYLEKEFSFYDTVGEVFPSFPDKRINFENEVSFDVKLNVTNEMASFNEKFKFDDKCIFYEKDPVDKNKEIYHVLLRKNEKSKSFIRLRLEKAN